MPTAPFSFTHRPKHQMNYEKEILEVLYEAGPDGLSVHKIAIHVHNAHSTLFSPIAFDDVRLHVQAWLLRNSRFSDSPVKRCGKRGIYQLNLLSKKTRQMLLEFTDADSISSKAATAHDSHVQPSLFDLSDK